MISIKNRMALSANPKNITQLKEIKTLLESKKKAATPIDSTAANSRNTLSPMKRLAMLDEMDLKRTPKTPKSNKQISIPEPKSVGTAKSLKTAKKAGDVGTPKKGKTFKSKQWLNEAR